MKNKDNVCAIYARYSSLDALTSDGVSRSIANQVRVLTEYAKARGFEIYKVYQDYNESGKDFNRKEIQELLNDAKDNKFGIVLIKDLSRFGRNYIEVGNFIDNVFPEYSLRLISINDNFDSSLESDTLSIAIKNFMNDYYLKDIGKKIRKSFAIKLEKESFVSMHFGYKIRDKKVTVYSPEAKIVKDIYDMFNSGLSTKEISESLKQKQIYTPRYSYYKKMDIIDRIENIPEEKRYNWKTDHVTRILEDEYYTGVAINAKLEAKSTIKRNIRFENDHEAIIPKEIYDSIDRTRYKNNHVQLSRDNLRGYILCKRCLSRYDMNIVKSTYYITEQNGKAMYYDGKCCIGYETSLMNKRIYDDLLRRYHYIKENKDEYIKSLLLDINSANGDALKVSKTRKENQDKLSKLFDKYMQGEIDNNTYKNEIKDLTKAINDADAYLKSISFDQFTVTDITNRVNRFVNLFYESDNYVEVIKANVYKVLYDPRNGQFDIILNLEHELDIPSKRIENIVTKERIKRTDFDIDKIVLDIIFDYPHLKIKAITSKAREEWDGFTYNMIKKSIQRLEHKNLIKMDGKSKLTDGYIVTSYKEDFDYNGLDLNRSEKEVYKALYDNPKLSYEELADILCISLSTARDIVIRLRKKGAFKDTKHFDPKYIPEGSYSSLYVGQKAQLNEEEILEYINNNPNLSRYKLAEALSITESQARRMQKIYKERGMKNA